MNSGEGFLSAFTDSLDATNILVVGNNIGATTSVGKKLCSSTCSDPPCRRGNNCSNGSVQVLVLDNMIHSHELRNSNGGSDPCIVML